MLQLSLVWRTPLSSHGLDFRCVSDRRHLNPGLLQRPSASHTLLLSHIQSQPRLLTQLTFPQNPGSPGRGPHLFCFSDDAFERDCDTHKGCADSQASLETREKAWSMEDLTLLEKDQVREQRNKMDIITHPWDLMEGNHGCWGNCQCHWKASWDYCWKIVVTKGGSSGLRESKFLPIFKKTWDRGCRELQAGQLHLDPWVSDAANCPGRHF